MGFRGPRQKRHENQVAMLLRGSVDHNKNTAHEILKDLLSPERLFKSHCKSLDCIFEKFSGMGKEVPESCSVATITYRYFRK